MCTRQKKNNEIRPFLISVHFLFFFSFRDKEISKGKDQTGNNYAHEKDEPNIKINPIANDLIGTPQSFHGAVVSNEFLQFNSEVNNTAYNKNVRLMISALAHHQTEPSMFLLNVYKTEL